jgi:hypothetical protein
MAGTRLIAPNGSTVSVSAERAKVLLTQGYTAADEKKATAKKASSSKSEK